MSPVDQDARAVAAAELREAAISARFYADMFAAYMDHGDLVGARRSKLLVEAAAIRLNVAWQVFEGLLEPDRRSAA